MATETLLVRFGDVEFWWAAAVIAFKPFYWNAVARMEYKTQFLSRLFGSKYISCGLFGVSILALGVVRDSSFYTVIQNQQSWAPLQNGAILLAGCASILMGSTLVLSSFYRLGFFGTFLGDYFGILKDDKITAFPFSVTDNPMYWGTSLNFLGFALIYASPAGLLLSLWVATTYRITIAFEGPFTEKIYSSRNVKKSG